MSWCWPAEESVRDRGGVHEIPTNCDQKLRRMGGEGRFSQSLTRSTKAERSGRNGVRKERAKGKEERGFTTICHLKPRVE